MLILSESEQPHSMYLLVYMLLDNNAGTSGAVQIANNTDAADSLRNVGITSLFYEVYDVRFINAASPDGYNEAYFVHGSNTTNSVYWYEDPMDSRKTGNFIQ